MKNKITISINAYEIFHVAELSDECSANELIEVFANLAESIGFSPALVIKGMQKAIDSRL
jgi:hypothetical protein